MMYKMYRSTTKKLGFSACEKRTKIFSIDSLDSICKIDSQWEFAVWLRKLKQGLCIKLDGWDVEGDGRVVPKGADICIPMADSC